MEGTCPVQPACLDRFNGISEKNIQFRREFTGPPVVYDILYLIHLAKAYYNN